jgi:RNA polymerase-binding transcription factor
MNQRDYSNFRKALEATVFELDGTASRRDAIRIDASGDELDRSIHANERDLAVRTLEVGSARLRAARAALRRMEDGTYGICLECDEPIGARRLAAIPAAALCIRCQEAVDYRWGARREWPLLPMAA